MFSITEYLTEEHRECDRIFAEAEGYVKEERWEEAQKSFATFKEETLKHFMREEDVLFPLFEARTGIIHGPTQVMRMEHAQARDLIERMEKALQERDKKSFFSIADTLMILIQQHNMKEEQILYPMCDQHLDPAEVIPKMESV
ncbi:hemerythrin domain-containing protein [Thermocrinis minervae]|uniref:Hemerythrin HHE cation binding domain-containing protein n=1 Tax=Thermocrinis minervae TaxID=381751 RepID=A0A1M6R4T2_9AQUI|nr:hemerythrin domain-containing protein [Thermocrinis minervae]SHK27485.1 Hemerythrin HHE cation binding domain-containing protein [Thermocrinis minervae]